MWKSLKILELLLLILVEICITACIFGLLQNFAAGVFISGITIVGINYWLLENWDSIKNDEEINNKAIFIDRNIKKQNLALEDEQPIELEAIIKQMYFSIVTGLGHPLFLAVHDVKLSLTSDVFLLWTSPNYINTNPSWIRADWYPGDAFVPEGKDYKDVWLAIKEAYDNGKNIKLEFLEKE